MGDNVLLRFPGLAGEPRLVHAVTTKPWNMACHCGPEAAHAAKRRGTLCLFLGMSFDRLTCAEQIHQTGLAVVDERLAGAGRDGRASAVVGVDGLLTRRPDTPLMLLSADCPLVLVYDHGVPAVGVAHASWRCTVAGITRRLVETMVSELGCDRNRLRAGIGPSAGPERYVVGEEVLAAARALPQADRYFARCGAGMTFDLWAANHDQLRWAGVPADHVESARICTIGDERFYSYRREGPETGRFALVAGIRSA